VFDWPVEEGSRQRVSQDYGTYGDAKPGFHTGIDIGSGGVDCHPETGASEKIKIKAISEEEVVVKIVKLGESDKGFGNSIITQHDGPIFIQYSHLDSIDSDILAGKKTILKQGDVIGEMGGSGSGILCKFPVHLHLEVKKFDSLLPPGYTGEPAYTPNTPSIYGYRDPVQYFHNLDVTFKTAIVKATKTEELRVGPGKEYPVIPTQFHNALTEIKEGQHYIAINKTNDGWYQVSIPTMLRSGSEMGVQDGWAHLLNITPSTQGQAFVWNVGENGDRIGLSVREFPVTGNTLAHVWDTQEISFSQWDDGWAQIDLPATEESSAQKAWVSGDYLFNRCHRFDSRHRPDGYGVPYNLFSTEQELTLNAYCGTDEHYAHVTGGNPRLQYIYNSGYEWVDNGWRQIDFKCKGKLINSLWCSGHASAQLSSKTEFYVAYICNWSTQEGKWKCGCQDTECATPYWQLQGVKR